MINNKQELLDATALNRALFPDYKIWIKLSDGAITYYHSLITYPCDVSASEFPPKEWLLPGFLRYGNLDEDNGWMVFHWFHNLIGKPVPHCPCNTIHEAIDGIVRLYYDK